MCQMQTMTTAADEVLDQGPPTTQDYEEMAEYFRSIEPTVLEGNLVRDWPFDFEF
jgi:hypothetical protein